MCDRASQASQNHPPLSGSCVLGALAGEEEDDDDDDDAKLDCEVVDIVDDLLYKLLCCVWPSFASISDTQNLRRSTDDCSSDRKDSS